MSRDSQIPLLGLVRKLSGVGLVSFGAGPTEGQSPGVTVNLCIMVKVGWKDGGRRVPNPILITQDTSNESSVVPGNLTESDNSGSGRHTFAVYFYVPCIEILLEIPTHTHRPLCEHYSNRTLMVSELLWAYRNPTHPPKFFLNYQSISLTPLYLKVHLE